MKLLFTFILIPWCLFFSSSIVEINSGYDLDWKLKKEKDGIKVFTRDIKNSNLKELRIIASFAQTNLSEVLSVLKNVSSYKDWVFNCVESKEVAVLNENEVVSYYKFDFPWPLSDRDIYIKADTKIDYEHKTALITTTSIPGFGEKTEDVVRVEHHLNSWSLKEVGDHVDVTYYLKSNPGGKIPDWVINLAVDKGPTLTITNLRELIQK
jgi:Icc-related predicted phosphoesterase